MPPSALNESADLTSVWLLSLDEVFSSTCPTAEMPLSPPSLFQKDASSPNTPNRRGKSRKPLLFVAASKEFPDLTKKSERSFSFSVR